MRIIFRQNRHDPEMVELYHDVMLGGKVEKQLIAVAHTESFSDVDLEQRIVNEATAALLLR
jgi:hypothetical protein